ncbi:MAG: hypothetical protein FWG92_08315, partial [Leptospirales bacterium]|nr:hypothetical protein [Leptospirales bacterium]
KKLMDAIRKIVSAYLMKPVIDLPWATKGSKVEIIVFPVNQDIPSIVEKSAPFIRKKSVVLKIDPEKKRLFDFQADTS